MLCNGSEDINGAQQFLHQRFTQIQTGESISQYFWEALSLGVVLPARSPTTGVTEVTRPASGASCALMRAMHPSLLNTPCSFHTVSLRNRTGFNSSFCYFAIFRKEDFLLLLPLVLLEILVHFLAPHLPENQLLDLLHPDI